jgi:lipopolysaccharide export system protein LptA
VKWQRVLRWILVLVAVSTIALVAFSARKRQKHTGGTLVARMDPKAVIESAGGRLLQLSGMKVPGFIDFKKQMVYEDGSMKLLGLKLTTHRSGREFYLSANEGQIAKEQSHVEARGNVVLTASDGLRMSTDEATYSNGEQIVRAPHKVEFSKGAMSGSGVGMTYDQKRDVLWLLDQVDITVAPDKKTNDPGAKITCGSIGFARREKYMRFERDVSIRRGGRTISADAVLAHLTDDEKKVKAWELRGNSHITMSDAAAGGLQAMGSTDMNLTNGPDGETIERALLAGGGAIQMAGAGGKPGRRIAANTIDVKLAEDSTVTSLSARQQVQLTVPADKDTPARVIQSDVMDGTGEPGKGLTGASFRHGVEFRELRQPNPRVAHSRSLNVRLTEGGGMDDAEFAGGTKFEDGTTTASGLEANYQVSKGRLLLTGKVGTQSPQVQDDRISVVSTKIDMAFEGPKLIATGEVQSVMKPSKKAQEGQQARRGEKAKQGEGGEQGKAVVGPNSSKAVVGPNSSSAEKGEQGKGAEQGKHDPKTPGLLKDDQPANVTAANLDYDGEHDKAIYTGSARLWQGDTAIAGDTITIDQTTGDLYASSTNGLIRTTMMLEQLDSKTQQTKKVLTIATGKDMHYEDELRRATYTTNAHVNGPQGDLRGVKIELYFVEGGGSLERAEAYDDVIIKTDERTTTGNRMTYFAADERYLMKGTPVKAIENCRETACKTLTFWRSTDRILCDGNEQIRTLATSGGTCGTASPPK